MEPNVTDLLPKLVWHMDEPTADPAIITCLSCLPRSAKEATVLLSGVGGDELFAGYRKYLAHYWSQAYAGVPSFLRRPAESALAALPSFRGTSLKGGVRLAKKMARSASLIPGTASSTNCTYLDGRQKASLYTGDFAAEAFTFDPAGEHVAAFERVQACRFSQPDALSRHQDIHDQFEPDLQRQDEHGFVGRSARAVPGSRTGRIRGMECSSAPEAERIPAADHQIHFAPSDAATFFPREVLRQPKAGFAAPVDYWLAHDLKDMVDDLSCRHSFASVECSGLKQCSALCRNIALAAMTGRCNCGSSSPWNCGCKGFLDGAAQKFELENLPQQVASA